MDLTNILAMAVATLITIIMGLAFLYWYMTYKNKVNNSNIKKSNETKKTNEYTKLSIFNFMEFDKIEDNMIIEDNGKKCLMVVECEGINYDLMSEVEKVAVEAGFIQFLNTLRHPIQIYTQTRTIKIENSIENYKQRLKTIQNLLEKKQREYNRMKQMNDYDAKQLQNLNLEVLRIQNMYDYGLDVITNIEQISQSKNVLRKHYYIIIPCYAEELETELLNEEEKRNMIFAELYTRAQSIIRTLFACSMKCKILDSEELAELLYIAYNRDESEIFGIDKAINAGYEELYSTAKDVLDKKIEALDREIENKGLELAKQAVEEVRTEKQRRVEIKEKSFEQLIKEMAEKILQENRKYIGQEVADQAIKKVKTKDKGGKANEQEAKKRTRRTTKPV